MVYSAINNDEVIKTYDEKLKAIPTNFNEKKITCKTRNFLLTILLITIALLIAARIYCYLIKYQVKQKHKIKTNLY